MEDLELARGKTTKKREIDMKKRKYEENDDIFTHFRVFLVFFAFWSSFGWSGARPQSHFHSWRGRDQWSRKEGLGWGPGNLRIVLQPGPA